MKCKVNKVKRKNVEPLILTNTPQTSFDTVIVDTAGPFKVAQSGSKYIVTLICDLTKYLITVPIRDKEPSTVARAIFECCILIYGPMSILLSDLGTEYVNEVSKELYQLLKIKRVTSTPYHHETVGTIERSHRVLNEYLRSYVNENLDNWEEYLRYFTYCYNITPHTSLQLKYSPFELVFAKSPKTYDFLLSSKVDPVYNFDNYAIQVKYQLQRMHQTAQSFLKLSKEKNKAIYDGKVCQYDFKVNDKVLLKKEDRRKLDPVYLGPFLVKEVKLSNVVLVDKNNKMKEVHKNRLIKYRQ